MNEFSITTRLTAKDYSKVMYIGLYKKPVYIIATLVGVYLVATLVLNYFGIINYYSETPYFEIFGGLFLLLFPTLIVMIAVKQFRSNPSCQNEIKYTFSENGISIQGITFKVELLWAHIVKQRDLSNFLILYHSKRMGNFIDKSKLTAAQVKFIKSKVGKK